MNGEQLYDIGQRVVDRARTALLRRSFASFGSGSRLCGPLRLVGAEGISVGSGVYVGTGCWLQGRVDGVPAPSSGVALTIGDRVSISGSATLSAMGSVVIEDNVLIARGVFCCDHTHRTDGDGAIRDQGITGYAPVRIMEGAWLGQNAVILPGVTIGRRAMVAANSVVREDVPPGHLAAGSPARVIRPLAATSAGQ